MTINVLEKIENDEQLITNMYYQISNVIAENKTKMIYHINNTLVETNYMIGKIIIEIWTKWKYSSRVWKRHIEKII